MPSTTLIEANEFFSQRDSILLLVNGVTNEQTNAHFVLNNQLPLTSASIVYFVTY